MRNWTHEESPEGKPSASAYRLGCRCGDCCDANKAYQAAYRARRVLARTQTGNTEYHSHIGQPSKRTAKKWKCVHPQCLSLAGLAIDANGWVVDMTTGARQEAFGKAEVTAPAVGTITAGAGM
jgi:hypothetical protein